MSDIHISIEAPMECWPEIRRVVAEKGGEMSEPFSLANPTEAPSFPVIPDPHLVMHVADVIVKTMAPCLSIVASLTHSYSRHSRDSLTGMVQPPGIA